MHGCLTSPTALALVCEFAHRILTFAGVFLSVWSLALASRTLGGDASWAIWSIVARGCWWREECECCPRIVSLVITIMLFGRKAYLQAAVTVPTCLLSMLTIVVVT